jgi:hypothetical protein
MKKVLAVTSILFLLSTTAVAKTNVTIVMPYPPGGTTHTIAEQIKANINPRYDVELVFTKSCAQALQLVNDGPANTILYISSGDVRPNDPNVSCNLSEFPSIKPFANFGKTSYYFCNSPTSNVTLANIKSKTPTVGYTSDSLGFATYMTKDFPTVKLVPYRGSGLMVKAIAAGDIDMWIGGGNPKRAYPDVPCIGSTSKSDPYGVPFLGTVLNVDMDELFVSNIMFAKSAQPGAIAAIDSAAKTTAFREFVKSGKIGEDTSPIDVHMKKIYNIYQITTQKK